MVLKHKAVGGIIVTSSHNPVQWNGLKFVDNDGLFLAPDMCEKMFALVIEEKTYPGRSKLEFATHDNFSIAPTLREHDSAIQEHIDAILALPYIDVARVAAKKYTVVLDAINGAGGVCMTQLLEKFGCKVIGMNIEPTGIFSHEPEPLPENLSALCEKVKAEKADFGTISTLLNVFCRISERVIDTMQPVQALLWILTLIVASLLMRLALQLARNIHWRSLSSLCLVMSNVVELS